MVYVANILDCDSGEEGSNPFDKTQCPAHPKYLDSGAYLLQGEEDEKAHRNGTLSRNAISTYCSGNRSGRNGSCSISAAPPRSDLLPARFTWHSVLVYSLVMCKWLKKPVPTRIRIRTSREGFRLLTEEETKEAVEFFKKKRNSDELR